MDTIMISRQSISTICTNWLLLLILLNYCPRTSQTPPDCPALCICPADQNNTVVDCSSSSLTTAPKTSADTKILHLSHNALGPIINDSFPRMDKLVDLDLSYNGLTRLLGCTLQGMLGLKRLDLRGNRLTSLPDSLFTDANGLEHLDISHNILVTMPDHVFRNLASLKSLDVSHNRMVELKFGLGLQVPRHLQTIDLSYNLFQEITPDSFQMASGWERGFKRTLSLANCRLAAIQTPAIGKIPEINDIDLSGNPELLQDNLTAVVKELETKGLERLSLSSLNLTTIEPFFTQVTTLSLKFLNVSDNKIDNVPANTFSTISSLRVLDISSNKLTSLSSGFSDLRNLKELNVSANAMSSFKGDDILSNLNNLELLDISGNALADPAEVKFGPLTKLTSLDVSDNLLTAVVLPETTEEMKHFDYHSNGITHFSGFDNVPKLEYFDISDNDLEKIEGYLFKQSRFLKVVNFSKNSVTELDHNAFLPQSSLVIDLSYNFLKKVQYSNWVATQELYLNHNEIEELDIQTFHLMNGLRTLDLSENKLSHLNEDILDWTTGLTYLNLSRNGLQQTHFFLLFRNLENLETLDLGNNNISHLNESMLIPIPKLKRFSLSNNHLEIVKPRVFRDLTQIKNIDLSGNPFVCNCENLGFQDWISRTKIVITGLYSRNSSAYVCKGPGHRVGLHLTEWSPDQFECDKTMLYMIIFGSVGLTLIVAGIASTIIYRLYKCHKRRKLEKEKEKFRAKCYGDDDDDDDDDSIDGYKKKKKGGKLDLSKMTSEEIAEEITHAIERRERRSMRKAEEMKKKNSNGYVPWPPSNGNIKKKSSEEKKHELLENSIYPTEKTERKKEHSKGRRESIEARQYDRIIQQQKEDASKRYSVERGGRGDSQGRDRDAPRRPPTDSERYITKEEDLIKARAALKVHRASVPQTQHRPASNDQRWKQRQSSGRGVYPYLEPEPEPDYGYETEPVTRGRSSGGQRYNNSNRWDAVEIWDKDIRGWVSHDQGQGKRRSRSQGHGRERYMTLPLRERDYPENERSSRREGPRLYLDQYTNEVRFGAGENTRHRYPRHDANYDMKPSSRQSRLDAYQHQQRLRSRSLHHLPQHYNNGGGDHHRRMASELHVDRAAHYVDNNADDRRYRSDDDRRPLIGPRAVSQPYLVSENTSDWL